MTHEELSELYELYVLGVLEAQEKTELEEHLASGCPQCRAGIRNALRVSAFLGSLPDAVEPPKALRRRVLASIGVEPKMSRVWVGALSLVSACLLMGVVVLSMENSRRTEELARVQAELRQSTNDLTRIQAAFQFLNEPDTEQAVFGKGQPLPPRGRIFVNRRGVLLLASNLPQAPTGKTYEMWLIPKTGGPIPAGLFQSDPLGNALYVRNAPVDLASTKAIAISVEPAAGSSAPTTTPIVAAGLSD